MVSQKLLGYALTAAALLAVDAKPCSKAITTPSYGYYPYPTTESVPVASPGSTYSLSNPSSSSTVSSSATTSSFSSYSSEASESSTSSESSSSSTVSESSISSDTSMTTTSSSSTSESTTSLTSSTYPDTTSSTTTSTSSSSSSSSSTSPPPSLHTCGFGTAFGYQNPVGGVPKSTTLNTQSGQGCNRWGWYETPTVAELQGGISGPLYVGAGGNDITKAVDVGIWVATANAQGRVTVTYLLNPPYTLAEVHVNLVCLPLTKCAPGQYTYSAGSIPNLPTWSNPTPLVYPTCTGGSKAALIVHAAVNILTVTQSCAAPVAS
ncbi:uncharacterized protein B0I36DRAFT_333158 [Microdochium trichocladiopsis]|uniref:Uncharacterized protein n=1 Tax=Microdochium trichocladiopsis TaxID=1682393 RepID=A0A9P9BK35_9PEZI|nr:uncharacterized protein B0I36DRAFT_333158 [Microdochium trichocladiopsis]KAH7020771.1 hypothetical protein B0I36DRAFT_333158 [Microdochium trichocladiopsis]